MEVEVKVRRFLRKVRNRVTRSGPEALVRDGLHLGDNVYLGDDVFLDPDFCWLITIGDDCTLAPRVFVLAHDASMKKLVGYTRVGHTTIGPRTFIGAGTIILPGVAIGADCIIGAGSVVSHDVPEGSVAVGAPAKVIGRSIDHGARHAEQLESRPHWPWRGWTVGGGISQSRKDAMARSLEDGFGYVE